MHDAHMNRPAAALRPQVLHLVHDQMQAHLLPGFATQQAVAAVMTAAAAAAAAVMTAVAAVMTAVDAGMVAVMTPAAAAVAAVMTAALAVDHFAASLEIQYQHGRAPQHLLTYWLGLTQPRQLLWQVLQREVTHPEQLLQQLPQPVALQPGSAGAVHPDCPAALAVAPLLVSTVCLDRLVSLLQP